MLPNTKTTVSTDNKSLPLTTDIKATLHDTSRAAFFVDKSCALNIVKPYRVFIFINYICNQNFILTLTI